MTLDSHDLGIVADDLTGACDVAACFAPQLGSVGVAVSLDIDAALSEDRQVINTQSRLEEPASARALLYGVGSALIPRKVIFKKIDAGLRGSVGAELAGLLEGLNRSGKKWRCVVAPAIPSIGRITRGGIQYDHGVPIHQGALGKDPHSPLASADIRQIIGQTGGGDYDIADAECSDDLKRIVSSSLGEGYIVFAGSLGLARALADAICGNPLPVRSGPAARRPLLVCGSRHPLATRQMKRAQPAASSVFQFSSARLSFDSPVDSGAKPPILMSISAGRAAGADQANRKLLDAFIETVGAMREKVNADGLAVIGGETAYQLLRRLGAQRLDVLKSQAEVIAISRITGGSMDGCRFVSKGGSVGTDDAACQMLSLLTS
jgi:uncharacterized protein YgbK (DUF1537 family)